MKIWFHIRCLAWLFIITTSCITFSAPVNVYFLPKDKDTVAELLPAFMDEAQKEILGCIDI